jgi:DNA (cytosine-5)-methyltransferase 1
MNELALFAGAGGGILGGHLLGWRTVCAVEWEPYPASVLIARQNEGVLSPFPIWDDVRTFDGRPWRGRVDVVSGGFPCQDISAAGKGAGIDGERSGMWGHMARIIGEVRPRFAFVENSPMLTARGLGRVLGDLAAMGYDARWGVLGAVDAGAPHKRDRIWIVGDSNSLRELQSKGHESDERGRLGNGGADLADADSAQCKGDERPERVAAEHADISSAGWWTTEPDMGRVAHGVAARVDRLKAIGNGQVPSVAALAWRLLN